MADQALPADPSPPEIDDLDREIVALTDALVGRVWAQFQARVAELSLSGPEAKTLQVLEPGTTVSMRDLAGRMHANPSNVTVAVSRLEARRLVTRQGGEDRRVRGVQLTDAGREVRDRLIARLARDHPALTGLSPSERETLVHLLRTLSRGGA